ncbi:hypothetical protein [Bacillus cereus group sp. BfR-BA-01408]|uniref:hypothetical protein n=1 Tax=Bacillus cereus group sp. BfR-BA-01408 TaxID=2920337 RepID=UPI001F56AC08|nr:hypothetical protein [Bacillus cereus group sp. BfR-BA-01408]
MKSKGALRSFLVLVILLGFLPIEKASASVSSNPLNEVANQIDTSKNYYIVPADSPTKGLRFRLLFGARIHVLVGSQGDPMKLHFSEENKKYRIEDSVNWIKGPISYWFSTSDDSVYFGGEENAAYWTITPVEGGYTLQAEGGYLKYENIESPMYGPLTMTYLGKEKVVWKLVPVL